MQPRVHCSECTGYMSGSGATRSQTAPRRSHVASVADPSTAVVCCPDRVSWVAGQPGTVTTPLDPPAAPSTADGVTTATQTRSATRPTIATSRARPPAHGCVDLLVGPIRRRRTSDTPMSRPRRPRGPTYGDIPTAHPTGEPDGPPVRRHHDR